MLYKACYKPIGQARTWMKKDPTSLHEAQMKFVEINKKCYKNKK